MEKDTLRNILREKEFCVNSSEFAFGADLNATSAELPYGESELEHTNLTSEKSVKIKTPKIAQSKWTFECKLSHELQVGDPLQIGSSRLILGEVVYVHLDDTIATLDDKHSFVDVQKLNPLARLSGANYCLLGDQFRMTRPK
jgi:flavin reductase (DIM6/NTAB) family NADH-FMN oxidoreductase RutF